jgi:hypothetical protein
MTFGIVKVRYSGTIGLSRPSIQHPAIYDEMRRLAHLIAPDFPYLPCLFTVQRVDIATKQGFALQTANWTHFF